MKKRINSLILPPLILSALGVFFIFEATATTNFLNNSDIFHFFKLQLLWITIGISLMTFFYFLDYHKLYYLSFILMSITIPLLIAVLIPATGVKVGGARRWLKIGTFKIQPTELTKFSLIIYLASWFQTKERKRFFSFLILLTILVLLTMLQPDMGTTIIIFAISITIYFIAGIELYYLLFFIPLSFLAFLLFIKVSPYRFKRLIAFLDPTSDPLNTTYHSSKILLSIISGGLLGKGILSIRDTIYVPEAHTDSIFAIIAQKTGFVGSILILSLFFLFLLNIYKLLEHPPDRFAKLLASGIFAYFSFQITINLLGMVNLLPLTGIPLPFLSYGGSHTLVCFSLTGILMNIAKKS